MADSRAAALEVLEKCRRSGAWSDAVLGSVLDAAGLHGKERSFAAALCYGVLQNRILLDHIIAKCASIPFGKIEPKVLDLLRIGAYQLKFMDRVPDAAAVNSAVALCKSLGYARASGFVNAVLRQIARREYTIPQGNGAEALSVRYSHPIWLTERLIGLLGAEEAEAFLRCDNASAPITIQTNLLKTDTDALLRELLSQGFSANLHPYLPDCILLDAGSVILIPAFQRGEFYVQDAAAKMAVLAAAPQNEQRILDVCAAPGGKTFATAIISGGAEILSCDLHGNKLRRIEEGARRLGLEHVTTLQMDARVFEQRFERAFDLVIADVPCSGLGVIRKKPDIRYKDAAALAGLPEIQSAILRNVSRYVKPDGVLLYSTCTILPEENGNVIAEFLKDNADFRQEDFTLPDGSRSSGGMLQLWPQRHGTDGFFIAKMRKWN